jgi:hypothetical protein
MSTTISIVRVFSVILFIIGVLMYLTIILTDLIYG